MQRRGILRRNIQTDVSTKTDVPRHSKDVVILEQEISIGAGATRRKKPETQKAPNARQVPRKS